MLVLCWSGEQIMRVMTNWWLSQWTGQETIRQIEATLGTHILLLVSFLVHIFPYIHMPDMCW